MTDNWLAVPPDLFFTKNDPEDLRLGDIAKSRTFPQIATDEVTLDQLSSKKERPLLVWGYPDDEGIRLNGGRLGAESAPFEIRKYFYKMTPASLQMAQANIADLGNLKVDTKLADRHEAGRKMAAAATQSALPWISLGGGHDYGYSDGAGFIQSHLTRGVRPFIINIDAHMDVRPTTHGFNSGTPFRRLLEEFSQKFDFIEMGVQDHCNSLQHISWAEKQGALVLPLTEIRKNGLLNLLKASISTRFPYLSESKAPLWLSLDIDGITSNEAPGCSQSWTTGLTTVEVMDLFHFLAQHFDWQALSIYEVSPTLDADSRTSKLAALFMYQFYRMQTSTI